MLPGLMHKCYRSMRGESGPFTVWGSGTPLRQFIYSEDLGALAIWVRTRRLWPAVVRLHGPAYPLRIPRRSSPPLLPTSPPTAARPPASFSALPGCR